MSIELPVHNIARKASYLFNKFRPHFLRPFFIQWIKPAPAVFLQITSRSFILTGKVPICKDSFSEYLPDKPVNLWSEDLHKVTGKGFPAILKLVIEAYSWVKPDDLCLTNHFIM